MATLPGQRSAGFGPLAGFELPQQHRMVNTTEIVIVRALIERRKSGTEVVIAY
jgi:hypothetical protein